ncbi:COX15/CtaA family protein [Sphingomonas sp.]|uniref:COX15/CtaA family protein n=1 Tax=Sphingomonas sp. TaxID=28214 RepID=UPI0025D46E58|nr:COX15/CtaA family protein [Sphingomonas sp.]
MARFDSELTRPRAISHWLLAVAALVFLMVVVGGITRLTESGLSITEWKPVSGTLPPLNDAAWVAAFEAYKRIPQFAAHNADMTLAGFKTIFFWEYVHRLLGRVIGLAFALPLAWFAIKRAIPKGYGWRLVALLALGGLQGTIGWWMVASGLTHRTEVSHFRLAVHLITALTIIGGLVWTALDLRALARNPAATPARMTVLGMVALAVLAVQIMFGAFTSGLRAGAVASTWPLMNDHIFPEGVEWLRPVWETFAYDPYLIHFTHRWWAWVVVAVLIVLARRVKRAGVRPASMAIHASFGTQILLGIATVMSGVALPLAALHQAVGALVVAATVWGVHALGARGATAR